MKRVKTQLNEYCTCYCLTSCQQSTGHIWREQDIHFFKTGPQKRKGAGSELVLDFTARERDCDGCLRESRAKLACSVKAALRLLTHLTVRRWGLTSLGTGESHRLQIGESAENFEKEYHHGEIQLRG